MTKQAIKTLSENPPPAGSYQPNKFYNSGKALLRIRELETLLDCERSAPTRDIVKANRRVFELENRLVRARQDIGAVPQTEPTAEVHEPAAVSIKPTPTAPPKVEPTAPVAAVVKSVAKLANGCAVDSGASWAAKTPAEKPWAGILPDNGCAVNSGSKWASKTK